jgi:hypothetical protein
MGYYAGDNKRYYRVNGGIEDFRDESLPNRASRDPRVYMSGSSQARHDHSSLQTLQYCIGSLNARPPRDARFSVF